MAQTSKFICSAAGVTSLALIGGVARILTAYRASRVEKFRTLPGDILVPQPMYTVTQAVSINAPPEQVWQWLAQMGAGRAGWYSYDRIDNGGRPSATAILPEYQQVERGDLFPGLPGASEAFVVAAVRRPRHLVLTAPKLGEPRVSWAFILEPQLKDRTRLLVRARVSPHWLDRGADQVAKPEPRFFIERVYDVLSYLPRPLLLVTSGLGHRTMQNRQLGGIKRRAEA